MPNTHQDVPEGKVTASGCYLDADKGFVVLSMSDFERFCVDGSDGVTETEGSPSAKIKLSNLASSAQAALGRPPHSPQTATTPSPSPPSAGSLIAAAEERGASRGSALAAAPPAPRSDPASGSTSAKACAACGVTPPPGGRLLACSGCKSVRYCDAKCQKAHWKAHKAACKAAQQ